MTEGERRKIAIVDDDLSVRDSLRFLLEVMGRTVETFASAAEFLQVDVRQFACLILDQHMPNMTGLELAGRLRADGTGTPILLITGSSSPSMVAKAIQFAIDRILEKPPADEDLLEFVNRNG